MEQNLIDSLLSQNNLKRIQLKEPDYQLLRSISYSLFKTDSYFNEIQAICLQNLKQNIQNNKISNEFQDFQTNIELYKEYISSPYQDKFEKINLIIISYFFKAKILVYWIDKNNLLNQIIINKNFDKKIEIFKEKEEKYDAVIGINDSETKAFCQELVQQMIYQSVDNTEKKDMDIQNLEKQLLKKLNIQNYQEDKENQQPNQNQWKSQSQSQFQQKTFFFNNDNFQKNNKYKQQQQLQLINSQYPPGIFKSVCLNGQQQPMILEESKERFQGKLKFFDEQKNYGFIIMDNDKSDIFVHFDDLSKGNISKEFLKTTKNGNEINFSYKILSYIGKYDKSRKAIDLELITN